MVTLSDRRLLASRTPNPGFSAAAGPRHKPGMPAVAAAAAVPPASGVAGLCEGLGDRGGSQLGLAGQEPTLPARNKVPLYREEHRR